MVVRLAKVHKQYQVAHIGKKRTNVGAISLHIPRMSKEGIEAQKSKKRFPKAIEKFCVKNFG